MALTVNEKVFHKTEENQPPETNCCYSKNDTNHEPGRHATLPKHIQQPVIVYDVLSDAHIRPDQLRIDICYAFNRGVSRA